MSLDTITSLTTPLPFWHPKAWYYGSTRILMRSIGALSDGIALGFDHGFDSGVMLDYVYRNQPGGKLCVGKWIDRAYLDSPGWRGIRARGQLLQATLKSEILKKADDFTGPVRVLDLACGGGRYVLQALADLEGVAVDVTLRDYRVENVNAARNLANRLGIIARIEQADAFNPGHLDRIPEPPDIVIVSGLHEILADDALVEGHFRQLAKLTSGGSTLLLTIQPDHPQVEFIARVLPSHTGEPWAMRLRPVDLTRTWLEQANFSIQSIEMESHGIFGVVAAKKE